MILKSFFLEFSDSLIYTFCVFPGVWHIGSTLICSLAGNFFYLWVMHGYLRFKERELVSCWDQACLYEKEFGLWQLAGLYTALVLKHLHLVLFLNWRSLVRWLLREVVSRCGQRGPCVADLLRGHVKVFWSFASPETLFLIMIHCLVTTSKVNCMLGSLLHFCCILFLGVLGTESRVWLWHCIWGA